MKREMLKTSDEIKLIEKASRIVAETLSLVQKYVKPGTSTLEIDKIAEDYILSKGGHPTFKGYQVGNNVFPNALCISINEEIIHGIPREDRILFDGDIVSIDCGVYLNGYNGDSAVTYPCGIISPENQKLLEATEESLKMGLKQAINKNKLYDIGRAVQGVAQKYGFSVNQDYTGHGIGKHLHEEPSIPNFVPPLLKRNSFPNVKLISGMALAIEPMVHSGQKECFVLKDNWTVVTKDKMPAAHFEHTVIVADNEPIILTLRD